jgi:hypothetical protein
VYKTICGNYLQLMEMDSYYLALFFSCNVKWSGDIFDVYESIVYSYICSTLYVLH